MAGTSWGYKIPARFGEPTCSFQNNRKYYSWWSLTGCYVKCYILQGSGFLNKMTIAVRFYLSLLNK